MRVMSGIIAANRRRSTGGGYSFSVIGINDNSNFCEYTAGTPQTIWGADPVLINNTSFYSDSVLTIPWIASYNAYSYPAEGLSLTGWSDTYWTTATTCPTFRALDNVQKFTNYCNAPTEDPVFTGYVGNDDFLGTNPMLYLNEALDMPVADGQYYFQDYSTNTYFAATISSSVASWAICQDSTAHAVTTLNSTICNDWLGSATYYYPPGEDPVVDDSPLYVDFACTTPADPYYSLPHGEDTQVWNGTSWSTCTYNWPSAQYYPLYPSGETCIATGALTNFYYQGPYGDDGTWLCGNFYNGANFSLATDSSFTTPLSENRLQINLSGCAAFFGLQDTGFNYGFWECHTSTALSFYTVTENTCDADSVATETFYCDGESASDYPTNCGSNVFTDQYLTVLYDCTYSYWGVNGTYESFYWPCGSVVTSCPTACDPYGTQITTYCVGSDLYGDFADGACGSFSEVIAYCDLSCSCGCPDYGTTVGDPYCSGYDLYQEYADGYCGTYSDLLITCEVSCGCGGCDPYGTAIGEPYCVGSDFAQDYADGSCGSYYEIIEYGTCA